MYLIITKQALLSVSYLVRRLNEFHAQNIQRF